MILEPPYPRLQLLKPERNGRLLARSNFSTSQAKGYNEDGTVTVVIVSS